ncbi:hypothetical protein G9P44_003870 [Scheffersomyces stipitis]|nr:hypothetical protein G9P44_003870 [Scheffersomyces stipitis]
MPFKISTKYSQHNKMKPRWSVDTKSKHMTKYLSHTHLVKNKFKTPVNNATNLNGDVYEIEYQENKQSPKKKDP